MKYFKKSQNKLPEISTASLPDIVFMLLFFFMTVTTIKSTDLLVENDLPSATEVSKLDKKDRIIELYVGKPKQELIRTYGDQPKLQIEGRLIPISDVDVYVLEKLNQKPEHIRNFVTVALKIDENVNVGIVKDIKKELQKINALKINFVTNETDPLDRI